MQPAPSDRSRSPLSRRARRAVSLTAVLIVSIVIAATQTVPELILFRERLVLNLLEIESAVELQPLDLQTGDGLVLRSWYHPPADDRPVIVYFPGRRGDILKKPRHLFELAEQGYGLALAGYRGYGGNPGHPSENRLYEDATALMLHLSSRDLAPGGIVLYGYSLGTGIASYLAAESRPRGVILEAPFTSFPDVVRHAARPLPLWMVRTRFDTRSRFTSIHVPILLLAGEKDDITPAAFAERLAIDNAAYASLHVFADATHGTLIENGAWDAILGFLRSLD